MQQTKEKAPCTVAAVQDAIINEPTKAQDKNTMNELISQLWDSADDLNCLRENDMEDINKVLNHVVKELSEEKAYKQYTGLVHSRFEYYYSMFSILSRAYRDVLDDVYTVIYGLNKIHDQMEGSVNKA